jgi:hypothetical protein
METKTVSTPYGLLCMAQSRLLRHFKTVGVRLEDKTCHMSRAGAIHCQDTMQTAANIARRRLRIKSNLLSTERTIICTVLNMNVG